MCDIADSDVILFAGYEIAVAMSVAGRLFDDVLLSIITIENHISFIYTVASKL